MDFIVKLKDESIQHNLFDAFNTAYERDFNYEILFKKEKALLTMTTTRDKLIATYILEDFNLKSLCPGEDAISGRFYGVTDERSRKVYLSFMKKTFPEYKVEYIKNLEKIKEKSIEEINSL